MSPIIHFVTDAAEIGNSDVSGIACIRTDCSIDPTQGNTPRFGRYRALSVVT